MNSKPRYLLAICCLMSMAAATASGTGYQEASSQSDKSQLEAGKELFTREWLPNDKRSFAGDGLGPVHNARSCLACHNQGGVGGAGPRGANSIIVSAFVSFPMMTSSGIPVEDSPNPAVAYQQPDRAKLAEVHPALRTERSFVLYSHGIDKEFDTCQSKFSEVPRRDGVFPEAIQIEKVHVSLISSERNPPSLFGTALIDRIPDSALEAVAREQAASAGPELPQQSYQRTLKSFPIQVSGRILHLKDGRIGRFGWKNSVARSREFVLLACATEIGLEVPGFHRAAPPWNKDYRAPGLDLNEQQAKELVRFVASLPRPGTRKPASPVQES